MATRFRYFEDYQVGQEGVTSSRTLGETSINTFAHITGDYQREHLDRHAAAKSPYKARVAHGLLGSCLVPGMISQTAPHIIGRNVPEAFFRGFETNYRRAIRINDTIMIHWRVSEMTNDPRADGFGLVTTTFKIINQDDVELYDGMLALTVRKESAREARLQFQPVRPLEVRQFVLEPAKTYYLEDHVNGEGQESGGRTMTEADVVNFTGLTGDLNPLYVDAVFAKESLFGERIVPPMLVFSAAFPLMTRDCDIMKTQMSTQTNPQARNWAGHLADGAVFLAPAKIGDTLRCRLRFESTRASRSKPEMGILRMGLQVINQRNELVQEGHVTITTATRVLTQKADAILA